MNETKINISYWTYPEGDEFNGIEEFKEDLSKNYEVTIDSKPTDALGSGLYEIALEIINNFEFAEIAKDLIIDGVKTGVGVLAKPVFDRLKSLFNRNKQFNPDINSTSIVFKDLNVIIYSIFENSIGENIEDILNSISDHYPMLTQRLGKIKEIHIPIFNQVDIYAICAFRVKLDVDENITSFSKSDYFNMWGIRSANGEKYIFNLNDRTLLKTEFYTQTEYNKRLDERFNAE